MNKKYYKEVDKISRQGRENISRTEHKMSNEVDNGSQLLTVRQTKKLMGKKKLKQNVQNIKIK